MFCGKCGAENPEGSKFCTKCGYQFRTRVTENQEIKSTNVSSMPTTGKAPASPAQKTVKKSGGKWKWIVGIGALFVAVGTISFGMLLIFIVGVGIATSDDSTVASVSDGENANASDLDALVEDLPVVEGLGQASGKPRNDAQVEQFTEVYGGVWYVTKEFTAEKEWVYYELGKKLMIFAWNNLNDYSYDPIIGTYEIPMERRLYYNGRLIDVEDAGSRTEFIYGETQYFDGIDIDYNEKFIVLTDTEVDLSGLGGPKFAIEDFRYENINGKHYLISDIYGFALMWDGTYLEYCEPDTYGHFQGYYAFRYYTIDSIINQEWNDD
ncbi:MAG: zinc ribbon domain-containing protein [Lachnospiraceae bacterium]|nr:zinc ribbon domain-containing protein [Lachnospiraceae bacterium]